MTKKASAPGSDLLVVAPHPDDAEIGLGGLLALLAARGRRVWVADLTRGELGSNAGPDERWDEAQAAADVLGLTGRVQLELPDGFIDAGSPNQVAAVGALLRSLRPRWVVGAPDPVRHPDHVATPNLVARAAFLARLAAWRPEAPAHRHWSGGAALPPAGDSWTPEAVLHVCAEGSRPAAIFDVSPHWETKERALACYGSQFSRAAGRRDTMINDPAFLEHVERRARAWGRRAGVAHAEALAGDPVPVLADLPGERWA